ncbi:pyridoxamine 5'-phosphate oxidase family protein [Actinomadura parmotrematis]|uniref:Pyridoxamine 5'-phosphate oxidase family protein n=1 Tax=Actinomadura parmotrematis TaxID=2864039 RepID=A0ABS7FQV6_9ACTN|nr:pyridoxamine 5'-phosphate oxidase family protein [Actinomadura parmotrematis]MBW8482109.1 pyridoxamine 5'-phosphate oxidase family protein [Actinomadura parmotrematis]
MVTWPDGVDEIFGSDQAVMLAGVTPARGVVQVPVTNFGVRDRDAGTLTFNSALGGWKKLERIKRDPHVALAFHTRAHGYADRPEYVLVQGTATVTGPVADYPETLGAGWERFDLPRATGPVWGRWLRDYYVRMLIEVAVERIVVWPDLRCAGAPEVHGPPLPAPPAAQAAPAKGAGPRLDHTRAARSAARLPDALLGWVGGDGFPVSVPVRVDGADEGGMRLDAAPGLLPEGGRRAGLTAHSFTRYIIGQEQHVHTGWLDGGPPVRYAPHTRVAYRMPPSRLARKVGMGVAMRVGRRSAARAGVDLTGTG